MQEHFGRYQLIERIALGGFAEIFKARAVGLAGFEKTLAIKRLHPRYSQDSDFIAWMVDEAKLTSQLSHPNICQVFGFCKGRRTLLYRNGVHFRARCLSHHEKTRKPKLNLQLNWLLTLVKRRARRWTIPIGNEISTAMP